MSFLKSRFYLGNEEISYLSEMVLEVNNWFSYFYPGKFKDQNSFESVFAKQLFYEEAIEFFIQMFESFHSIHPFHDGNKRTLHYLFSELINKYTLFIVDDHHTLAIAQIAYLESKISKSEFISITRKSLGRKNVMKSTEKCNFEHLIPRIDVNKDFKEGPRGSLKMSITLSDLEYRQAFYKQLRKPIFQRDTNYWDVTKLSLLIDTFKKRGLIPAVILWSTQGNGTLIVDGAHRLSALISWVNDDYGKEVDLEKHLLIKEYIDGEVGAYTDLVESENMELLGILSTNSLQIQWVQGDYEIVKTSFIRINEQGAELTKTEQELIINDTAPVSMVTRAILSEMNGQKSIYKHDLISNIVKYLNRPHLSTDESLFPILGDSAHENQLQNIYELVTIFSDEDSDTISENLFNIIDFIVNTLELNNRIYFYNKRRVFKKASFIGIIGFIDSLVSGNDFGLTIKDFLEIRFLFEENLVNNEKYIQQIVRKKRQAINALDEMILYYQLLMKSIIDNGDDSLMLQNLTYLTDTVMTPRQIKEDAKYRKEVIKLHKCSKCGGYINSHLHYKEHKICKR
jgi:prophage maintenance system killer protein